MKITVIGTGYVGLVTGTCLAETGNNVTCVDVDQHKLSLLAQGIVPLYEPGLAELIEQNRAAGRLAFTADLADALRQAKIVFLAVGTPPADDGSADLTYLLQAVQDIAPHLARTAVVAVKSTVPVGTNARITALLRTLTGRDCDVVSNPEFLKEGAAIEDFMRPDRVIVGVRRPETEALFRRLYSPYLRTERPLLAMSPESAEMSKYAANALLAMKISFINEIAGVCEHLDADIADVRRGIGHDRRIGFEFLFPGAGYGGSCFPKDVRALEAMARSVSVEAHLLSAVSRVNDRQKKALVDKIVAHFGARLVGKTFAIWGLAFKPRTDDVREAPALVVIDELLARGAQLKVHDPEAMPNARRLYGERLGYCTDSLDALRGVDALVIVTEWKEFQNPDLALMRQRMRQPVIFDGRNLYEPRQIAAAGFIYYSIGRRVIKPAIQRNHAADAAEWSVKDRPRKRRTPGAASTAKPSQADAASAFDVPLRRQHHGA